MAAQERDPDGELRRKVERRTLELWQAAGRPEGRELEYRLQAEEELGAVSVAGEEDPMMALDHLGKGALSGER